MDAAKAVITSSAWTKDAALLEQLLYKNKNQHRNSRQLHSLQEVLRCLRQEARVVADKSASMTDLLSLVTKSCEVLESCARKFYEWMTGAWFLPFTLTVFACVARLHALHRVVLKNANTQPVQPELLSPVPKSKRPLVAQEDEDLGEPVSRTFATQQQKRTKK